METPERRKGGWGSFFGSLILVLFGGIVGAAGILVLLWDRFPELHQYFQ